MNIRAFFLSIALILLVGVFHTSAWGLDLSKPVKKILVEGNQRANGNTIRFYIHSKEGEPYSIKETREDIRRIYNLGYFDDITLDLAEEPDGLVLTYNVKEKPFVRTVALEGSSEVPEKDIKIFLKLKKGTFFQHHLVKQDIKFIKKKYLKKGYYFTDVKPVLKDAGNNQVDVTYVIDEKKKIKIGIIEFVGNRFFKDHELTEIMETKKVGFWSFISDEGNFSREELKTDLLRIEAKYRDFGFIKASLEDPRVEVDKEKGMIIITLVIEEGEQYFVRDITAEGDDVHTAEELLAKIQLKKGEPFNQSQFRQNLFDITEMYSDNGYAYANPVPVIDEDHENRMVDIHLRVDPGSRVYIGKIKVTGNEKTSENVIRREFRLHEGELFSSGKLTRTRQRLVNTGFFDEVNIEQKSGAQPELMDLDLSVIERETGNIRAGLGYSSVENLMIQGEVSESNFLGSGRRITVGLQTSSLRSDYNLAFTEPRFMDREILLGFELYSHEFDYTSYISRSEGGSVSVGRSIGEYTSTKLKYVLETVKVSIQDISNTTAYLKSQEGRRLTSSLSPSITKDTRDNYLSPKDGYKLSLSGEVAGGPLGGELDFYKIMGEGSRYFKLPYDFVFMARSQVQYAAPYNKKDLPVFEQYFLGGPYTLRGFSFRDVGPMDSSGDAIGGDSSLLFNLEVNYDFSKNMRGVLFYDRGQVYGSEGDLEKTTSRKYDFMKMRHSAGFGLRVITPMMPLELSWGFKLDKRADEAPMEFNLVLGQSF